MNCRVPITSSDYNTKEGHEWKYNYSEEQKWLYIGYAYKDDEGREWVYIDTFWNDSDVTGWICASDPDNEAIPAFDPAPKPMKRSPDGVYNLPANEAVIWPPADPPEWTPDTAFVRVIPTAKINAALAIISLGVLLATGAVLLRDVAGKRKGHVKKVE